MNSQIILVALWLLVSYASGSRVESCNLLSERLKLLPNTTIHETSFVAAGTNLTFPNDDSTCTIHAQVVSVDICRVSGLVETGPSSNITMEAWLPLNWTGRFLAVGNGGMGGCIKYNDINYGARLGFATIGTNNGHNGNSGRAFFNNPGVIEDYVYRSVHIAAAYGKQITKAFYLREHTKSFYLGCSTGGRQGFKEAQKFPEDFDGIVAGAPAFALNALQYAGGQFLLATGNSTSPRFLSATQWNSVYEDINRKCDGLDGVLDGVIEDPDLCQYSPESLICGKGSQDTCLTGEQASTVRRVFGPVYGSNGTLIFPRLQPGVNATDRFLNGQPFDYMQDWFRYVIYNDPSWDPLSLNEDDWLAAERLNPNIFDAATWEGDLSNARDRGTKILHYHGLQDPLISSENSARYYNHVARTMNLPPSELDSFYRYFRIAGMGHCREGSGPNTIGGNEETFTDFTPEGNVLAAIVQWVEKGIPPDSVLGKKFSASGELMSQRRHCRYPRRNHYRGTGDPALASSWTCVD